MEFKTIVQHWRYEDGWREIPTILRDKYDGREKEFDEALVGWHCWVYPANDKDFARWMKKNMKGKYECDFRFNSGDPMFTVLIKDDQDATLFKLTWM